MTIQFANNFSANFIGTVLSTDTTAIPVTNTDDLPVATVADPLIATFEDALLTKIEIVLITNVDTLGNTIDVVRGQEGTLPQQFEPGDFAQARVTAGMLDAFLQSVNAVTDHTQLTSIGINTHDQLDLHVGDTTIHFTVASIDHTAIQNIGTNSHADIDLHIGDATIHFTEASIDHTAIQNVGTNSHASIDLHIGDSTIHFTEASISHLNIQDVGVNTHAQLDLHVADATIHFTEASISHLNIQDVGVNTHAQIDTHIADATIHFTEASISHLNIQDVGTNSHALIDSHIADATIHFTEASISHLNIQDVGTNSHALIDSHIADATIHFTEASIDHGNLLGLADDDHTQYLLIDGTRAMTGALQLADPTGGPSDGGLRTGDFPLWAVTGQLFDTPGDVGFRFLATNFMQSAQDKLFTFENASQTYLEMDWLGTLKSTPFVGGTGIEITKNHSNANGLGMAIDITGTKVNALYRGIDINLPSTGIIARNVGLRINANETGNTSQSILIDGTASRAIEIINPGTGNPILRLINVTVNNMSGNHSSGVFFAASTNNAFDGAIYRADLTGNPATIKGDFLVFTAGLNEVFRIDGGGNQVLTAGTIHPQIGFGKTENGINYSNDLTNAVWSKTSLTLGALVPGPDNEPNGAIALTFSPGGVLSQTSPAFATTANRTFTAQFWIRSTIAQTATLKIESNNETNTGQASDIWPVGTWGLIKYTYTFSGASLGPPRLTVTSNAASIEVADFALSESSVKVPYTKTTNFTRPAVYGAAINGSLVMFGNIISNTGNGIKIGTATTQKLGFWNATPAAKQTVSGSRAGNAALTDLLTKLATVGLIVDNTTV